VAVLGALATTISRGGWGWRFSVAPLQALMVAFLSFFWGKSLIVFLISNAPLLHLFAFFLYLFDFQSL